MGLKIHDSWQGQIKLSMENGERAGISPTLAGLGGGLSFIVICRYYYPAETEQWSLFIWKVDIFGGRNINNKINIRDRCTFVQP